MINLHVLAHSPLGILLIAKQFVNDNLSFRCLDDLYILSFIADPRDDLGGMDVARKVQCCLFYV